MEHGDTKYGIVINKEREKDIVQPVSVFQKIQKLSVSHPVKSSISIRDKTPKTEHRQTLACKLTTPLRFKL